MKHVWHETGAGLICLALGFGFAQATSIGSIGEKIAIALFVGIFGAFVVYVVNAAKKDGPIQVFLPQWDQESGGDFYQDGFIQKKGFEQAEREIKKTDKAHIALNVKYNPMDETTSGKELLKSMKEHYEKGSRYFVMTMSGKVEEVWGGFREWRSSLNTIWRWWDKRKAPVLIVTVASAPNLADAKNGIVRWYIRSEEESRLLADYLSKLGFKSAAAFGVTHHDGTHDSTYGKEGIKQFCEEFEEFGGNVPDDMRIYVTAKTAKPKIEKFLKEYKKENCPGIFVVGYGDMVKNTLTELVQGGYEGCIACTSTLTDRQWQPPETILNKSKVKIFTVLPRLKNPKEHLVDDNRNVVFFFARKTLLRVLKLTAGNTDSNSFLENWTDGLEEGPDELKLEYFKCGDVLVHLHIVSADKLK